MKRNVPIDKAFEAIRRLPPEMEFAAISQFVMQHPVIPVSNHFNWFNLNNFFTMIVITSLLTVALVLTRPSDQTSENVSTLLTETVPQARQEPIITAPDPPKQEAAVILPESKNKPGTLISPMKTTKVLVPFEEKEEVLTARQDTYVKDANKKITDDDSVSSTSETEASANSSTNYKYELLTVINDGCLEKIDSIKRVRTAPSCKCNCNFGDDNEWIDQVVKELSGKKLIDDECEYKFKITANSVSVNGKDLKDEQFAMKLNGYYEAARGEKLKNNDSYVMVKVSPESCNLTKSINN